MVTARPTPDSDIKVEVWLPDAWNGKLLGTDNGGFSGAINYAALVAAVTKGYAAVSTDTGHTGDQMDFGIGHPGKDRGLGLPVGARDDDDRQDRRRTRTRTRAGAVVLQRLLDRRTTGAQRSAALSRRLRRHRRRRSREQPDQPYLRVSLVVARDARHGRHCRSFRARSCRRWRRPQSRRATRTMGSRTASSAIRARAASIRPCSRVKETKPTPA